METQKILEISEELHVARKQQSPIERFSSRNIKFDVKEAYAIQKQGLDLRIKDGEKFTAMKMGLTSEEKRKQMDLHSPLFGVLTNTMEIPSGGSVKLDEGIHPKIEPELAFLIEKPLTGEITRENVIEVTSKVVAALEILDSRYSEFKYFSLEDVVADNSSSFKYILSQEGVDPKTVDVRDLKMSLFVNEKLEREGNSNNISGDPVQSIVELFSLLKEYNLELPTPCYVLAGAATQAIPLGPDMKISLEIEKLGNLTVETTK